jgi:hypothetical protein
MRIPQGEPIRIPFLLVGEDAVSGVPDASVTTTISINGQPFQPTQNAPQKTGDGWYYIDLNAEETAAEGPLVLRAGAPEAAFEWRDIHQVAAPNAEIDPEAIRQIVADELAAWEVVITAPIKLIRVGATG